MPQAISPAPGLRSGHACAKAWAGCRSTACWCSPRAMGSSPRWPLPMRKLPAACRFGCCVAARRLWGPGGRASGPGFWNMADRNDDIWYSPYDQDDRSAAMTAYLQWEVDLLGQISKESGVDFNCAAAAQDNFLQPQENVR